MDPTTEPTLYIGGLLEKVEIGGVTDWRHSIVAGGETVAIVSRKSSGTNATWYLLKDHLGSIAKILNGSGQEYVSESFEAFGARRDPNDWSGPCPCADLDKIRQVTRRGYTEHEMIGGQSMGLIHMNGRVQDAIIGRFLSADPMVQAPFDLQSLNRYSYVFNNPLSATDPSGFECRMVNDPNLPAPIRVCDGNGGNDSLRPPGNTGGAGGGANAPRATPGAHADSTVSGFVDYSDPYRDSRVTFAASLIYEGKAYTYRELTLSFGSNIIFTEDLQPNCYVRPVALQPVSCDALEDVALFETLVPIARAALLSRAATGLASLPFRSGDVILREFQTLKGILDIAAEAQVAGRTLHLKDIAVFPRGTEALNLGSREVMALRNQLTQEARALGFKQLRITGTRVTGANPGKTVDIFIDLTKLR